MAEPRLQTEMDALWGNIRTHVAGAEIKCLFCGRPKQVTGVFVTNTDFGQNAGKTRHVIYGLCMEHMSDEFVGEACEVEMQRQLGIEREGLKYERD